MVRAKTDIPTIRTARLICRRPCGPRTEEELGRLSVQPAGAHPKRVCDRPKYGNEDKGDRVEHQRPVGRERSIQMNIHKIVEKTTFTIIAAVTATTILAFAVGCGSESPAAAPAEATDSQPAAATAPNAAVQAPEDAEAVPNPANEPDIVDFMDADTARMFQAMNSDWQGMARDSWGFITTVAPQDDWQESAGDIVAQMYADAKSKGGTRDALVEGVQTPADATDLAYFMDEEATRLFEEMTPAAQRMVRDVWDNVRATAPREVWMDEMGDFVTQLYADAKIHGEIRGVEVAGVQDLVDPSKGPGTDQSVADSPPFVLGLLPPKYLEAYQIIPEGSLMREYMDNRLRTFSQEGWEATQIQDGNPYPQPAPELGARDEADLKQMLRDAVGEDWLVERVRSLDVDAGQEFQAAGDVEERLGVLRRLVEVEGKRWDVLEIREEWKLRSAQWSEERIADYLENVYRSAVAEIEARSEMTPTEFYLTAAATMICGDLMNHIVGQDPRTAASGPAECDIDKVIALTRAAVAAGQAATSEEEFRTAIEYYEETGQWTFSVTRSSPEGE